MDKSALLRSGICTLVVALAVQGFPALAGPGDTELVSVSVATNQAAGQSHLEGTQSVSADGRFVVFTSEASDLVWGDTNGQLDVFVRDRLTGTTDRVSVGSDGTQGDRASHSPSISADGRYVAFTSNATFPPHYSDGSAAVFVRDRWTGQTERVSTRPAIGRRAITSADGRFVTFSGGASATTWDVLVYDRLSRTTEPVSQEPHEAADHSVPCAISADGRHVAFSSFATNLVPGDTNGLRDVFVRDRMTALTSRVSVASAGHEANGPSDGDCSISADGRFVGFLSYATNLDALDTGAYTGSLFVRDRQLGLTERVSLDPNGRPRTSNGGISLSMDGRYVAFDLFSNNIGPPGIFVRDRRARRTQSVALPVISYAGATSGRSPSISADGRFIAFETRGSNLVPDDVNDSADVFIHERIEPSSAMPRFTLKPSTNPLAFGDQPLSESKTLNLWLRNKGVAPLPITVTVRGIDRAMFKVVNRCASSVPAGTGCSIRVTFTPTSIGDKSARLRVVAGVDTVRIRPLTGTGVAGMSLAKGSTNR